MKQTPYEKYAEKRSKKSPVLLNTLQAFLVGGLICTIGQALTFTYEALKIKENDVKILVPCTLVFAAAFLTGIGIFDNIAKFAGAGTLVPITGFANAVVSPAIDCKNEGYVLGVGAKMFTVAGPVILYGTVASVIYGLIYYIMKVI